MATKEKNITHRFNSIGEFVSFLDRGTNQYPDRYGMDSSQRTDSTKVSDCTTASYEEANSLLAYGNKVEAERIMSTKAWKEACERIHAARKKREVFASVVGFAPHVANYIAGVPNQMLRTRNVEKKSNTITLVIACSTPWNLSAEAMLKASENIAIAVQQIESGGTRVQIYAGAGFTTYYVDEHNHSKDTGKTLSAWVRIKAFQQKFELLRTLYPIGNPSFFRRHMFRLMEITPNLSEKMTRCYGYQMNKACIKADTLKVGIKTDAIINIKDDYYKSPSMLIDMIKMQMKIK